MRRLLIIATLSALSCVPAWAQMRGARGGMGVAARPAGVMRAPMIPTRPVTRGSFGFFGIGSSGCGFGGFCGFHHFHHHHFFRTGFGFSSFIPVWYWGNPWDYSSIDYDQSYDQAQQLQAYQRQQMIDTQQRIEQRLNALEDRLDRLLEQRSAPAQPLPQAKAEPPRSAVLVYRDGHTQEVQNYAIVGQTLWVFNEQQAKKIPLSELDLDATRKANQDRDIDLPLPKPNS